MNIQHENEKHLTDLFLTYFFIFVSNIFIFK